MGGGITEDFGEGIHVTWGAIHFLVPIHFPVQSNTRLQGDSVMKGYDKLHTMIESRNL